MIKMLKKNTVSILGSTGSIGTNTLNVISSNQKKFSVLSLSSKNNINLLTKQSVLYKPKIVAIQNKDKYKDLKNNLFGKRIKVVAGDEGVIECTDKKVDITVASIVGIAGLKPTLNSINNSSKLCLANKECLVSAGYFFMKKISRSNCKLLPIDSEHNAIFQLCDFKKKNNVESITLTASGGPFRKHNLKKLKKVSLKNALKHPNWKMGNKITIDSATMMNKAFEIIEAFHLFNLKLNQIKVVVHPESIIHSLVNFKDGSTTALLCDHDMRIPIFYALYWPSRESFNVKKIDLFKIRNLSFEKPNIHLIDSINLAYYVLKKGGPYSLIFNAANEVAVKFFLKQKIKFMDIIKIVKKIISISKKHSINNLEDIYSVDKYIRELTEDYIFKTYGNCN
ncbi:MAG: 1-deoxy-D-xylulose-5-phosphate reductoisomerase [Pelagibacteraceae bacterium]|nr:1-deoxy-D-xylulose-5-phosphate reductoisomerase [Pelagibacteraceae bacterium]|tara:strand:- start:2313 stop:3497 length:1185 start_codon:yes stop_codon:yes gene_type:complete